MPMPTYTFEDYKNAIKAQYEEEVRKGGYSNNLNSPTPANLRNLCLKRFNANTKKEDLIIFESFFEFAFDKSKRNLYGELELNKLTSVQRFLLGRTETPTEDTVQFSAILVDFQPRPFFEFMQQDANNEERKQSSNPIVPHPLVTMPTVKENGTKKDDEEDIEKGAPPPKPKSALEKIREKILANFRKKLLITAIVIAVVFLLIITLAAFLKKDCMIWVNDHYEELERTEEGYCETYYDARYFNLKKIAVCDTTSFFDNNGKPKVWYFKVSSESIECFDRFAPYPLNTSKFLKPITPHMIARYLANRPKCKQVK
jgi:hypothetical protein